MNKGFFISIEGCEGSGKTTLLTALEQRLNKNNIKNITTREPGGVKVSESIRSLIMDNDITSTTEALLFAAARVEHIEKKVRPHVEDGYLVIADRYLHSSVVYQGYARGLGIKEVYDLNVWATGNYMPSFVIYLDIKPADGLKRIEQNSRDTNRFDHEKLDFHQKIYDGYAKVFENESNVLVVDALKTKEEIVDIVYDKIMELYV